MNLTLISRFVRYVSLVVILAVWETSAPADVITLGDVDPGGSGPQPDPWAVGGNLKVGDLVNGRLSVEAGGVVSAVTGYLGYDNGSTGVATVTGADSRWINSDTLSVGREGSGTLNVEAVIAAVFKTPGGACCNR